jgi:hypothetical protein
MYYVFSTIEDAPYETEREAFEAARKYCPSCVTDSDGITIARWFSDGSLNLTPETRGRIMKQITFNDTHPTAFR